MTTPTPSDDPLAGLPGLERRPPPVKRQRVPIWLLVVVFALVIVLGVGAAYLMLPLNAPLPDDVGARYEGLERGFTEQGFPRLGSASVPLLIEDFSSYACIHCARFFEDEFPGLLDAIADGRAQFVLIPVTFGRGAPTATRAALCAGEQGRFWEMNDTLFSWQGRFVGSTFHARRVRLGAEALGLDVDAFETCMDGDAVEQVIERARSEYDRRGLRGTPSLFANGERVTNYDELRALANSESVNSE